MSSRVAFISGPLDSSDSYFTTHYAPKILSAIAAGDSFVVGPVRGIDTLALHFLLSPPQNISPDRITVFMTHTEYATQSWREEYEKLGVKVFEEGVTTRDRDAAMTRESDYDILRYRTEEEAKELYGEAWWPRVSNTEMNERRRKGIVGQGYKAPSEKAVEVEELKKLEGREGAQGGFKKKILKLFGDHRS